MCGPSPEYCTRKIFSSSLRNRFSLRVMSISGREVGEFRTFKNEGFSGELAGELDAFFVFKDFTDRRLVHIAERLRVVFSSAVTVVLHGFGVEDAQIVCEQRSEEHTSELQSRGHLVCRLLL